MSVFLYSQPPPPSFSLGSSQVLGGGRLRFSDSPARLFIENLEALRNPIPFLVSSELQSARKSVREELGRAVLEEAYGDRDQAPTLFKELALLYEGLEIPPEAFTDCHLVAIVGLLSNVIHMMTWTMCHILADSKLKERIVAEIEASVDTSSEAEVAEGIVIDVDRARASCPLLMATLYEVLRTYGDSPVARYVYQDGVFGAGMHIEKGSIIMTPIHLHNFDGDIWGPDANEFCPDRFLLPDGQVNQALPKHLNVFGLPGMHQCPGRYLGLNLIMGLVAKTLLTFDMTPLPGRGLGNGVVPARKETMLGLPAIKWDPRIRVGRRSSHESIRVCFDNIKPGW